MATKKDFSAEELAASAKPNASGRVLIAINGTVYDVTDFATEHPGGRKVLLNVAGKDASKEFASFHRPEVLTQYGPKLAVGRLAQGGGGKTSAAGKASGATAVVKAGGKDGKAGAGKQAQEQQQVVQKGEWFFGEQVPYGDPYWYQGFSSPYYKDTHRRFRDRVRAFVDKEITPFCHEWDEAGTYPPELHKKAYDAGLYAASWPKEYGGTPPEDFDAFHDLILIDELGRCGAGGILWAVFFSFGIALPPILSVGSQHLKDRIARDVITGKKIMSLAVTEPYAGSDVASLASTARREGNFYIVNGEKKFITSGTKADYFTVAVRTGGAGMGGVSLLLIESNRPGVTIRRQKTQGWWISGTAYIVFEDVKVPVENLIGKENDGFKAIMHNFNHERFVFAGLANRFARVMLEEAIKYARVRKTFGQRLIDHQVIRHKMAEMARKVETTHAMLEQVAYQMSHAKVPETKLGGVIALLKVQATKTMEFCARESSQVLGGNSYVRGGIGDKVERLYREVRVNAIAGGSEEVLMDLAMKQSKL